MELKEQIKKLKIENAQLKDFEKADDEVLELKIELTKLRHLGLVKLRDRGY